MNLSYVFVITYFIGAILFHNYFRKSALKEKHTTELIFFMKFSAGIIMLLFIPLFEWKLPTNIWFYIIPISLAFITAMLDKYQAICRKELEVSAIQILSVLERLPAILFATLILLQPFSYNNLFTLVLFCIAIIIAFYRKNGTFDFNKYSLYWIGCILSFGTITISLIEFSKEFNIALFLGLDFVFSSIFIYLFLGKKEKLKSVIKNKNYKNYLCSFGWAILQISMILAYHYGNYNEVSTLLILAPFIIILSAFIISNERKHIFRYLISSILISIGLYFLI